MKNICLTFLVYVFGSFFISLFSCSEENTSTYSKFYIRLCDAPGDYAEVNVEVINVQMHVSEGDDEGGWKDFSIIKPGIYNLLAFTNGKDSFLASHELPAGKVSQIRLILGDNNSVKLNDGTVISDLKVPSGLKSGIKLKVNAEIIYGVAYTLYLDFDAAKSIVDKGNKSYSLKPAIRTFINTTSGSIKGIVSPLEAHPNVMAISSKDTLSSYPDSIGKFLIRGIPGGTYKVVFQPAEGFKEAIVENVTVNVGSTSDLKTITMVKQ